MASMNLRRAMVAPVSTMAAVALTSMGLAAPANAAHIATTAPAVSIVQTSTPGLAASRLHDAPTHPVEPAEVGPDALPIVIPVIAAVLTIYGGTYAAGRVAGERVYHAGLRNEQYQQIKWQVRGFVMGAVGSVTGPIFMLGFENRFYELAS